MSKSATSIAETLKLFVLERDPSIRVGIAFKIKTAEERFMRIKLDLEPKEAIPT